MVDSMVPLKVDSLRSTCIWIMDTDTTLKDLISYSALISTDCNER